jgi:hypothetical protein
VLNDSLQRRRPRHDAHGRPIGSTWSRLRVSGRSGLFRFEASHDLPKQLIMTSGKYIDQHNKNPQPFIWSTKASDILDKVTRA